MRKTQTQGASRRPGDHQPALPAIDKPPVAGPRAGGNDTTGPREIVKQAARDIRRGLLDTDLHGVPSNVPGPHRDPERSEGAVVPPKGVDRTTYGKRR